MDKRKEWTQEQSRLRKLLASKASFATALELFFRQHAATHAAAVYPPGGWSIEDEALAGLSDEQIRHCPPKSINSIAWLLWHIARIEDMTIGFLVLGQPQIIHTENWLPRLNLSSPDCGAGMTENDVRQFSSQVNIDALKAYRREVGCATRQGVRQLSPDDLKTMIPNTQVDALVTNGSISPQAPWLADFYMNRPKGFFLIRTATSHNFLHMNQAWRLGKQLRGKEQG